MKRILIALTLVATPAFVGAQEAETLIGGDLKSGGFGGPVVKLTKIDSEFGVVVGARGGWILNDSFVLGGGIYGVANEHLLDRGSDLGNLVMGYGGLELEYILRPNKVAHVSVSVLVGGGAAQWDGIGPSDEDPFFVTEPGLNVLVNITRFMRMGFGASYRFVDGVDLPELDDAALGGPSGVITFKFGGF